ncbi:MAG: 1,4-beta-xylanase, partial [Bacteroidales bacterium]|nr:1,4-beta-xylanase [Bacteroidales bacterium]
MRKTSAIICFAVFALVSLNAFEAGAARKKQTPQPVPAERWTAQKANDWYDAQPWPVGCVFVPSYAGTPVEMWAAEYFDAAVVDRELGLAEELGFNAIRLFLCDIVWQNDPDGFMDRLEQTLSLADRHGMRTLLTFFTNGGTIKNPYLGPQPQPEPGIHNSTWMSSPGR